MAKFDLPEKAAAVNAAKAEAKQNGSTRGRFYRNLTGYSWKATIAADKVEILREIAKTHNLYFCFHHLTSKKVSFTMYN